MQGKELPSDDLHPAVSRDRLASPDPKRKHSSHEPGVRACFGEHQVAQRTPPPPLISSLNRCLYTCIPHLLRTSLRSVAHLSNTDVLIGIDTGRFLPCSPTKMNPDGSCSHLYEIGDQDRNDVLKNYRKVMSWSMSEDMMIDVSIHNGSLVSHPEIYPLLHVDHT